MLFPTLYVFLQNMFMSGGASAEPVAERLLIYQRYLSTSIRTHLLQMNTY